MKKTKSKSRGGGVLLKKYGPDYFRELREKQTKKHRLAMDLWNKTQKKKSAKSVAEPVK